jgi:hypothetical protein
VNAAIRSIAENASGHGHAGNLIGAQSFDESFLQGFAVPLVVFAKKDTHELCFAFGLERWNELGVQVLPFEASELA